MPEQPDPTRGRTLSCLLTLALIITGCALWSAGYEVVGILLIVGVITLDLITARLGRGKTKPPLPEQPKPPDLPEPPKKPVKPRKPIAAFECSPTEGVAPLTVHFDPKGSRAFQSSLVKYVWRFGDGKRRTTSQGKEVEHTFLEPGDYEVELTVHDERGLTRSARRTVSAAALVPEPEPPKPPEPEPPKPPEPQPPEPKPPEAPDELLAALLRARDEVEWPGITVETAARTLGSAAAAYAFVRDGVVPASYPSAFGGAAGTLRTRTGNSVDRALLLAELLQQLGYETRLVRAPWPEGAQPHQTEPPARPEVARSELYRLAEALWSTLAPEQRRPALELGEPQARLQPVLDDIESSLALVRDTLKKTPRLWEGTPEAGEVQRTHAEEDWVWVEARKGRDEPWQCFDPVFPDQERPSSAENDFAPRPARLSIRVEAVGEDGSAQEIVAYKGSTAEAIGHDISLVFLPGDGNLPTLLLRTSPAKVGLWLPVLRVGPVIERGGAFTPGGTLLRMRDGVVTAGAGQALILEPDNTPRTEAVPVTRLDVQSVDASGFPVVKVRLAAVPTRPPSWNHRHFTVREPEVSKRRLPVAIESAYAEPRAVIIVIDCSHSMFEGGRMEIARQALKNLVELLRPSQRVALLEFWESQRVRIPVGRLEENRAAILRAIDGTTGESGTHIPEAITAALTLAQEPAHILFLTDGIDSDKDDRSSYDARLARAFKALEGTPHRLIPVGIGEADHELLERVARATSSRSYRVSDPRKLPELYREIGGELAGLIQLSYQAEPQRPDEKAGAMRHFTLALEGHEGTVEGSYALPPAKPAPTRALRLAVEVHASEQLQWAHSRVLQDFSPGFDPTELIASHRLGFSLAEVPEIVQAARLFDELADALRVARTYHGGAMPKSEELGLGRGLSSCLASHLTLLTQVLELVAARRELALGWTGPMFVLESTRLSSSGKELFRETQLDWLSHCLGPRETASRQERIAWGLAMAAAEAWLLRTDSVNRRLGERRGELETHILKKAPAPGDSLLSRILRAGGAVIHAPSMPEAVWAISATGDLTAVLTRGGGALPREAKGAIVRETAGQFQQLRSLLGGYGFGLGAGFALAGGLAMLPVYGGILKLLSDQVVGMYCFVSCVLGFMLEYLDHQAGKPVDDYVEDPREWQRLSKEMCNWGYVGEASNDLAGKMAASFGEGMLRGWIDSLLGAALDRALLGPLLAALRGRMPRPQGPGPGSLGKLGDDVAAGPKLPPKGGRPGKSSGAPPGKRPMEGDPVDVATGHVVDTAEDFALPGAIPFAWRRWYSSDNRTWSNGSLGPGWTHSFEEWLSEEGSALTLRSGDGREIWFSPVPPGGRTFHRRERLELTREPEGQYRVYSLDTRLTRLFAPARQGARALLRAVRDAHGNAITLQYEGEQLARLVDSAGREISVRWSGARIVRVEARAKEQPFVWVDFTYGARGCLAAATDALGHAQRYDYDEQDRMVARTLKNGVRFQYEYDAGSGRCGKTWGPSGLQAVELAFDDAAKSTVARSEEPRVYTWNDQGLAVRQALPDGTVLWEASYDEDGYVLEERNGAGETTRHEYDARGNRLRSVDPAGNVTRFEYLGDLLVRCTSPDGQATAYAYDARGELVRLTLPSGASYVLTYDAQGRRTAVYGPGGLLRACEFNARHDVVAEVDGRGARTTFAYDDAGRPVERRDALGRTSHVAYDRLGHPLSLRRADGSTSETTYDALGKPARLRDALGQVTLLEHSGTGVLSKVTEPGGRVWTLAYTGRERLRELRNPKGEAHVLTYDAAGRVASESTFDGRSFRYAYSAAGRLARIDSSDQTWRTLSYDVLGHLIGDRTPDGHASFQRDAVGRLLGAVLEEKSGERHATLFERDTLGRVTLERQGDRVLRFEYDELGRRTLRALPDGAATRYTYDVLDALAAVEHGEHRVTLERDVLGRETGRRIGAAGLAVLRTYDALDRLTEQRATAPTPGGGPQLLVERHWRYDPLGRVERVDDGRWGAAAYRYDAEGRLLEAQRGSSREVFEYDLAGALQHRVSSLDARSAAGGAPWELRPGNLLSQTAATRYSYDGRGRRVGAHPVEQHPAGGKADRGTRYIWDCRDRLREVRLPTGARVLMSYDAFGRRTRTQLTEGGATKPRTTEFLWDGDALAADIDSERGTRCFVHEPGTLVPLLQEERGQVFTCVNDHLGTPRELLDATGGVAWSAVHSAWGRVLETAAPPAGAERSGPPIESPFRLEGQYADAETGLASTRFRFFDPAVARWLSPDPLGLHGGLDAFGWTGNPVTWTDPLGLMPWRWDPNGMGHHLVPRKKANSAGLPLLGTDRHTPTYFPIPYTPGDHEMLHRAQGPNIGPLQQAWGGTPSDLIDASKRGLSDPSLANMRGELRIPSGRQTLGRDLTPAEAFDELMRWHDEQLAAQRPNPGSTSCG
jgi:RHS repeat-associated protein